MAIDIEGLIIQGGSIHIGRLCRANGTTYDKEATVSWQPIESAPLDGTRVILRYASGYLAISAYAKTERFEHGTLVYSNEGWWDSRLHLGSEIAPPTHWMPLPDFTAESNG